MGQTAPGSNRGVFLAKFALEFPEAACVISNRFMSMEIVPFGGWQRNVRLSNGSVELIITLDIGPRVMVYRRLGGENIFKHYADQLGTVGESEWKIRGGHRLWLSPEDEVLTYTLDNSPVEHRSNPDGSVTFITPAANPWQIRKELTLNLSDSNPHQVEVRHVAINEAGPPLETATWALTVMAPGGVAIIPQPPLGEHPRDLLPNRLMVVWPYTDLSDPRWKLGRRFITLRQTPAGTPTKLGLAHREKWVAYLLGKELFIKAFPWEQALPYPDQGCNFETFTNHEMLEVESLGPLTHLRPGMSTAHEERWWIYETDGAAPLDDEDRLAEWLAPFLRQAGL